MLLQTATAAMISPFNVHFSSCVSVGLFTLPDLDPYSDYNSDCKTEWLHSTLSKLSYCMELDSDSNPNCKVLEKDWNWDQNRNPDL